MSDNEGGIVSHFDLQEILDAGGCTFPAPVDPAALGGGVSILLGSGMPLDEAVKAIKDLLSADREAKGLAAPECAS